MATVYKGVGTKIARLPGVQPVLQTAADEIRAKAVALAGGHTDTGAYVSSLTVKTVPGKKGVRDRLIIADDPASTPIEFGHLTKSGTWVEGQYILTRALYGG